MSQPIWTPAALQSERQSFKGIAWRFVEAQHLVSTMKLVDGLDEQSVLEEILEQSKPPMPEACRCLHYLLSTPFRYRPYPHGSRFRRAGWTPGVWYGAERPEAAAAEMVFYRFLFYAESPNTPFPTNPAQYTAFSADIATPVSLDLTTGKLAADRASWTHLTDYTSCQGLAGAARDIDTDVIRYESVRDPKGGTNLAVLSCRAFASSEPLERQTWRIRISEAGAQVVCEHPMLRLEFDRNAFAPDSRLAAMTWKRPLA